MALSNLLRLRAVGGLAALASLGFVAACHSGAVGGGGGDAGVDMGVDLNEKLPPPDADCSDGGPGCPILTCGAPKAVSVLGGALPMLGADAVCTPGYTCIPDAPTASGDALQLRCVTPLATAVAFGAACSTGASATNRCKNDALCIKAQGAADQFCSTLCRADGDCPTGASCLDYASQTLPNGSHVNLGFCTPKAKISGTVCTRETDCAAGEGCLPFGARTNLTTCQTVAGTKSVGQRCTKTAECRSGQCLDRAGRADVNESYCSGPCAKNSDCGADQRCARVVLNNNGTVANPFDDLVVGACVTLFAPMAGDGCKKDSDCSGAANNGDTCATKYGLCYTAGAASGKACMTDQQCELGAFCNKDLQGGYCQTLGCAPGAAAGSVDSCPGAKSVCAQQAADRPLFACYEGCDQTRACSRVSERYACTPLPDGVDAGTTTVDAGASDGGSDAAFSPTGLCLYNQGV